MTKTWLSIAGAPIYLPAKSFGSKTEKERNWHISFRTRMDERYDKAIANATFIFVIEVPYAPWGQKLTYLWKMKAIKHGSVQQRK